jgi:hypothetical protein
MTRFGIRAEKFALKGECRKDGVVLMSRTSGRVGVH